MTGFTPFICELVDENYRDDLGDGVCIGMVATTNGFIAMVLWDKVRVPSPHPIQDIAWLELLGSDNDDDEDEDEDENENEEVDFSDNLEPLEEVTAPEVEEAVEVTEDEEWGNEEVVEPENNDETVTERIS